MMSLEFMHTYTHYVGGYQVYKYTLESAAKTVHRNEEP